MFSRWPLRSGRGWWLRRGLGQRANPLITRYHRRPLPAEPTLAPAVAVSEREQFRMHASILWIFTAFLTIAVLLFIIVDQRLKPTLMEIAEARATVIATQAINRSVNERIARTMKYEDLYAVRTDTSGRVVLMQPNTGEINRLASDATIQVQEALRTVGEERIQVPMGQVLGSQLLAFTGPWISVRVVPIGTVDTAILDRFEQAGINQTRHKIYMRVKATVRIVIPLGSTLVQVASEIPLAESIILGEVPQVYFGLSDKTFSVFPQPQGLKVKQ